MVRSDLLEKLQCPECRSGRMENSSTADKLDCSKCGCSFPLLNDVPFLFNQDELPTILERHNKKKNSLRPGGKSKPPTPWAVYHWEVYRFSDILPDTTEKKDLLIFGCGNGGDGPIIESKGYNVYGFDIYTSPATDIICDGHNLAFNDESFDVVLSSQVFEHLTKPWIGMAEIARVLRPGGFFVGSVAFMKPYHCSYFHMTHDGIIQLLEGAGLQVDHLHGAQSIIWSVLLNMLPIRFPMFVRSACMIIEDAYWQIRGRAWSILRKRKSTQPLPQFSSKIPLSYIEYHRLHYSPAVVFRGRKP